MPIMQTEMQTVYSLRVRSELRRKYGIEPLMENDNPYKPGLKCWVYERDDAFLRAFDAIMIAGKGGKSWQN